MVAAAAQIRAAGMPAPVCVVVHALFAGDALRARLPDFPEHGTARETEFGQVELLPLVEPDAGEQEARACPTAVAVGQAEHRGDGAERDSDRQLQDRGVSVTLFC